MSNLSSLHNYIDIHENNLDTRIIKKEFYNKHALRIFLAGMREPLGSTIRAMKPKDLAEARQFIVSEDNIRHLQRPNLEANKPRINRPTNTNINPRFNQIYNPALNQMYNSAFNQNYPAYQNYRPLTNPSPNYFPRNPINVQPLPVKQNYPTNKQVFGKPNNPTNVWKPKPSNNASIRPKPTPMSGISHGTYPKPNTVVQRPNYFQLSGQSNFISEELHNVEQINDIQNFDPNQPSTSYQNYSYDQTYNYDQTCDDQIPNEYYNYSGNETTTEDPNQNFHDSQMTQEDT